MHYRNGREAKNGDEVARLSVTGGKIEVIGVLYGAKSDGGSHCNGNIASLLGGSPQYACLCDCIHMDDLAEVINKAGLADRPEGM